MSYMHRIRITYANVVASLALFVAIGGSSYAALSVTGAQVRDGSLTGRDVRNGSLTGNDIHDRSLGAADFAPGQLPAGPAGPKGEPGAAGPAGPQGDAATTGLHVVTKAIAIGANGVAFPELLCPGGEKATGGGTSSDTNVRTVANEPSTDTDNSTPIGWHAAFKNDSGQQEFAFLHAVCAP